MKTKCCCGKDASMVLISKVLRDGKLTEDIEPCCPECAYSRLCPGDRVEKIEEDAEEEGT